MAFRKALEDPELRNEATKLKLALDPTWGAEAREVIEGLYATPQPIIERARRIVAFAAEQ
jgi:hypothetical protein